MSDLLSRVSASPPLRIGITRPAPATIRIAVAGEVDYATAPDLLDTMLNVLHAQHPAVLDVDLTDVSFLAGAGVGALACIRNAASQVGCQLRISHPQPMIRMVLELTGILPGVPALTVTTSAAEAAQPRSAVAMAPPAVLAA